MTELRKLVSVIFGIVLFATVGSAQTPDAPPTAYGSPISVVEARKIVDRGMELAATRGLKMAFAVVEPSGELVYFARMDDAPYASIRVAQQKARASARFRMPTAQFEERVLGGRTVLLSSDEVIAVGGGIPIVVDGHVVGALGVSGGAAAEDSMVATGALAGR